MTTLHECELIEVTAAAWKTLVGMPLQFVQACPQFRDGEGYEARIALTRESGHELILECGPEAARLAASKFFFMDPNLLSSEEMLDTLGELINVIAGNIAGLFYSDGRVGLPYITRRSDPRPPLTGEELHSLAFQCEGAMLRLRLIRP